MNRRLISLAAAAALVILPAAAAQAYVAPGTDLEVSDSTPAPGEGFQVVFEGANIGEDYTLTITSNPASIPSSDILIAGTASLTKTATSDVVAFTVTLRSAANFRVAITDQTGALVADSTVVVRAAAGAAAPGATGGGGALATTGSDPLVLGLGAAAVIALGAGTVFIVRRRQQSARV
ncbi:peptidase [Cellulomonas sp. S1-8]|uniref:peptidase n=1 Tax=Cellulomonas sp. S1-8 TaxID=2904790 RepID=UPI002244F0BD|nr:peptidase [Cellulomonas sp. S1-8]UZN04135.1 peptidase [Cellulomonas sp. S1-8]